MLPAAESPLQQFRETGLAGFAPNLIYPLQLVRMVLHPVNAKRFRRPDYKNTSCGLFFFQIFQRLIIPHMPPSHRLHKFSIFAVHPFYQRHHGILLFNIIQQPCFRLQKYIFQTTMQYFSVIFPATFCNFTVVFLVSFSISSLFLYRMRKDYSLRNDFTGFIVAARRLRKVTTAIVTAKTANNAIANTQTCSGT